MEKDLKIVSGKEICLFCGEEIKGYYQDSELYYECGCPDAQETRKIQSQIAELKRTLPEARYRIEKESVLYLKNNR